MSDVAWQFNPREHTKEFFSTLAAIFFGQAAVATVYYFLPSDSLIRIIAMWCLMAGCIACYMMIPILSNCIGLNKATTKYQSIISPTSTLVLATTHAEINFDHMHGAT